MATKIWNPKAADIPDVYTITIGGTWAANDTLTITCGGTKGVTIDLGASGSTTTSSIAAEVAAILVAESRRDGVGTGYSWRHGALEYGEFREIQNVSVSGSVVTIEGPPGVPITITGSETSTSGTVTVANPQAATGRRFWDDGDNWGGSVPADGDDIIIAHAAIGPQYGLPGSTFAPNSVTIDMSFTGMIGLPVVNRTDPNFPYQEYRTRAASFGDDGSTSNTCNVTIGRGRGQGSQFINITGTTANGASLINYKIINTGRPVPQVSEYAVYITNSTNNTGGDITISGGSVDIDDADVLNLVINSTVAPADVRIGDGVSVVSGGGAIVMRGGTVAFEQGNSTTLQIYGGTASYVGDVPVNLYIYGGTVQVIDPGTSQTVTNLEISDAAVLDCSSCLGQFTVTNAIVYGGGSLLDPTGRITFTNGIDLFRSGLRDSVIDVGQHFTISKSSI